MKFSFRSYVDQRVASKLPRVSRQVAIDKVHRLVYPSSKVIEHLSAPGSAQYTDATVKIVSTVGCDILYELLLNVAVALVGFAI